MTANEYNQKQLDDGMITVTEISQLVESWQYEHYLAVDGKAGPQTLQSIHRDAAGSPSWDPFDGPRNKQPKNRKEVFETFGDPGISRPDLNWKQKNIVQLYGDTHLPMVPEHLFVHVNKVIEPYLREALRRAKLAKTNYEIERIGGYVWRHIRYTEDKPLSLHSWGIAIDIDPHKNGPMRFGRGKAPRFMSHQWKNVWPEGLPRKFVEAFTSCGFAWGGDWDEDGDSRDQEYLDPMHFEWVARNGRDREV